MSSLPGKENQIEGRATRRTATTTTVPTARTAATSRPTLSGLPSTAKDAAPSQALPKRTTLSSARPAATTTAPKPTSSTSATTSKSTSNEADSAAIEQLKSKIEILSTSLSEKETQLAQRTQEYTQLQREITKYRRSTQCTDTASTQQIEKLIDEKTALLQLVDGYEDSIQSLKNGEKVLLKKNQEMEREFENLQQALETAINARISTENFTKSLQSSQSDSTTALSQLQASKQVEIDELQSKMKKLQQQMNAIKEELASAIDVKKKTFDDYATLKSQFIDVEVLNVSLTDDINVLNEEKLELMKQLMDKEEELENGSASQDELNAVIEKHQVDVLSLQDTILLLQNEKTNLSNDLQELQAQLEAMEEKYSTLDNEKSSLLQDYEELDQKMNELYEDLDQHQHTIQEYKTKVVELEDDKNEFRNEIDTLIEDKSLLSNQLSSLENNHMELKSVLQDKNDKIAQIQDSYATLQSRADDQEVIIEDKSKLVLTKEQIISTHESTIQTQQLKNDELLFDSKQKEILIERLQSQVASLTSQLTSTSSDKTSSQQQYELVCDEFEQTKQSNQKLLALEHERYNTLDGQHKTAQNTIATLHDRISELQQSEAQLQDDNKNLQEQCDSTSFDLEENTSQVKSLENKVRDISAQLSIQVKKSQDMQVEILDLDEECQKLTDTIVPELQNELSKASEKAQRFETKFTDLEAKNTKLYEEKVQLDVQYNTTLAELNTKAMLMEEHDKMTQQLQLESSQLRSQINELSHNYEEKLTILSRLQQDYYAVMGDKSTLEQSVNALTQQLFEAETNAALSTTKLDALQSELQTAQRDHEVSVMQYKADIEQLDNDIKTLRNKNTMLDAECIQLSDHLSIAEHNYQCLQDEAQQKLDEYDIKFDDFTYKRKETEQLLKSRAKEAQSAQQEVTTLTEEKMELHVQVGKLRDEIMLLQQDLSNKNNAVTQLKRVTADNKTFQDKVMLLEQQKQQLKTTLSSYEADKIRNKDVESKYFESMKAKDDLANEKLQLTHELQNISNKFASSQQIIEKQTHAIEQLTNTAQTHKKKLDDLTVQCIELTEQVEEANHELVVANEYVTGLNKKYDTLSLKQSEYKEKIRQFNSVKLDQDSIIERLQREVQDLQSELTTIQRMQNTRRTGASSRYGASSTTNAMDMIPIGEDMAAGPTRRTRRVCAESLTEGTDAADSSVNSSLDERKARIMEARSRRNQLPAE